MKMCVSFSVDEEVYRSFLKYPEINKSALVNSFLRFFLTWYKDATKAPPPPEANEYFSEAAADWIVARSDPSD